jgi:hypothetical protein
VGDAIAAQVVVDERLDGRDASRQRGAQRILALVEEEPRALALARVAERTRCPDTGVCPAGDQLGTPLSPAFCAFDERG